MRPFIIKYYTEGQGWKSIRVIAQHGDLFLCVYHDNVLAWLPIDTGDSFRFKGLMK